MTRQQNRSITDTAGFPAVATSVTSPERVAFSAWNTTVAEAP